jgi:hypothetical protein
MKGPAHAAGLFVLSGDFVNKLGAGGPMIRLMQFQPEFRRLCGVIKAACAVVSLPLA